MNIFIDNRKEDRRKIPCFIDKDRRKYSDRRGKPQREINAKQRKEFERHLNAQR